MNLTASDIKAVVAPGGKPDLVAGFATYFNKYSDRYGVNTYLRVCHFVAQCAEESDHFNTLHEYASGAEYQGRLGNVNPGDGVRYKGAGYIELTGRYNYEQAGKRLGLDLVNHPELALQPETAMLTALDYWKQHGCNTYADRDDIVTITHLVNGGENGLATRKFFLAKAKVALAALKGANLSPQPIVSDMPVIPTGPAPAAVKPTPPVNQPPSSEVVQAAVPGPSLSTGEKATTVGAVSGLAASAMAVGSVPLWMWIVAATVAAIVVYFVFIHKKG